MVIDNKFEFGDIVYFKVDLEQMPYIITGIMILEDNSLKYMASGMDESRWCYGVELSLEPNLVLKTNN